MLLPTPRTFTIFIAPVMGDLTKPQHVMRRQALEDELERTGSPADPHLDKAAALLADFARFWE